MRLPDIHARLIGPSKEIPAKQGNGLFTLIPSWAHAIMGTEKIIMGTILGTILCGFVRNMQAIIGTKSPQLRGLTGCFAEGFGLRRNARYFPMQKLANRRKAAPLRDCSDYSLEHGHNLGHTF